MAISVQFIEAKHSERRLASHRGAGTIDATPDAIVIDGRRPRKVLNFFLGAGGFLVGVVAAALGAVALEHFGIDLLAYRKGGGLIAMVALFLGVSLGGGLITAVEWVIGQAKVRTAIPRSAVEGIGAEDGRVAAVWSQGKTKYWFVVAPDDGDTRAVMDLLRSSP